MTGKMGLPLGAVQLAAISFVTSAMAIIALALRLWSRRLQNTPLAVHDYFAMMAMLLAAGAVSVFLVGKTDLAIVHTICTIADVDLLAGFAAGLGVHLDELLATAPQKFALHMKVRPYSICHACLRSSADTEQFSPGFRAGTTLVGSSKFLCEVVYSITSYCPLPGQGVSQMVSWNHSCHDCVPHHGHH